MVLRVKNAARAVFDVGPLNQYLLSNQFLIVEVRLWQTILDGGIVKLPQEQRARLLPGLD